MFRRCIAALAVAITAAVVVVPAGPAQATAGDGWSRIINDHSNLALQGRTDEYGVTILQTFFDPISIIQQPSPRQDWLMQTEGSYVRFRNAATAGWMAMSVNSSVAGTSQPVNQITNQVGNTEQLWIKTPAGSQLYTYTLKNVKTGKCLAIPGSSKDAGTHAIVWPCIAGLQDQMWVIHDNN
ncbi:RICIN domain-containing protein [Actinoplanes sp. L3-i22]|uniref:RICIN domain-containing protein n=1 Tax=Actinoplanes sp. L3-i22 TaxID=2836373 RepID=UPI001C787A93|nr:RICIN domain-containing protein [Actinoplanes sp. L3-i22]BCY10779.1 hypothetical protein L3i22_058670 [Actinoplanes sp. L3-i22]